MQTKRKGFISLAAIIVMMVSLSIVMSIAFRSTQGQVLVSKMKQGNQSYQQGDGNAEAALQGILDIDHGGSAGGISGGTKIPENSSANQFCTGMNVTCWKQNGVSGVLEAITGATTLSEVMAVSAKGSATTVVRAVQAPVTERVSPPPAPTATVSGPLYTSCTPPHCGSCVQTFLGYNVALNWNADDGTNTREQVKIRRTSPSTAAVTDNVSWSEVASGALISSATDTTVTPSQTYSYILKATNKNPLRLDSLYAGPVSVTIPPPAANITLTGPCP